MKAKPIEPLNIEINATQDRSPSYMQWVDIIENVNDTIRVYANTVLLTKDINMRLDWTFSPRLTFQCYMQPFYANMDYKAFFRLKQPKTMDLDTYNYLESGEKKIQILDYLIQLVRLCLDGNIYLEAQCI